MENRVSDICICNLFVSHLLKDAVFSDIFPYFPFGLVFIWTMQMEPVPRFSIVISPSTNDTYNFTSLISFVLDRLYFDECFFHLGFADPVTFSFFFKKKYFE